MDRSVSATRVNSLRVRIRISLRRFGSWILCAKPIERRTEVRWGGWVNIELPLGSL